MTPAVELLKIDAPDNYLFRNLVVAPDYSPNKGGSLLATWSTRSIPIINIKNKNNNNNETSSLPISINYDRSVPWVKLPFPAMNISWCPFKKENNDSSFLTVSRSSPLQLWDTEDASLRGSYCCYNLMGMPAQIHSTLWTLHHNFIIGGYGDRDDNIHVRLFDVNQEGDIVQSYYKSPISTGIVSTLSNGPKRYQESLILAGYMHSGNIDIIDTRHCGAAAILRGLHSGVAQIKTHPTEEYLIYAAGRLGENRIICWDIRKSNQILSTFERHVRTQQPALFGFVEKEMNDKRQVQLVTATHDGGVLIFDNNSNNNNNNNNKSKRLHEELGSTGGLTVIGNNDIIAVTVGERQYPIQDRYESNATLTETSKLLNIKRPSKRVRSPLKEEILSDSENECEKKKNESYIGFFKV